MKKSFKITFICPWHNSTASLSCWLLVLRFSPQFGAAADLTTIEKSPNYRESTFQNPVATSMDIGFKDYMKLLGNYIFGGDTT
jgi:hypothetical protein